MPKGTANINEKIGICAPKSLSEMSVNLTKDAFEPGVQHMDVHVDFKDHI